MGPLFVNTLAKKYSYGDLGYCKATADVPDPNYANLTYLIQNYEVVTSHCVGMYRVRIRSNKHANEWAWKR